MFPNQLIDPKAELDYRRERISTAFRNGASRGLSGGESRRHHHFPRRRHHA